MLNEKNLKQCCKPKLNELKTIKTGGVGRWGGRLNCHTLTHACSPWSVHSSEVIPGPAQAWETRLRSRATSIHLIPVGCVQDGKAKLKISRRPFLKIAWGLRVRRTRLLAEELWGFVSWCSNCVGHYQFFSPCRSWQKRSLVTAISVHNTGGATRWHSGNTGWCQRHSIHSCTHRSLSCRPLSLHSPQSWGLINLFRTTKADDLLKEQVCIKRGKLYACCYRKNCNMSRSS